MTDYCAHTLKLDLKRRGRLPPVECVEIGLALTTALAHLHAHGLVHRDIKPSNIIFAGGMGIKNVLLVSGHSRIAPKVLLPERGVKKSKNDTLRQK